MSSAEPVRVSPVYRLSIKHVNSNASSASSSKRRAARVKRTIRRQRRASAPDSSFTGALVTSLADVAQAFLYPEESPNKDRNKNAVNTSTSTVDMSDEAFSVQYDEEEETFEGSSSYAFESTVESSTLDGGRSLDARTPPPTLVGSSEASAFAPSSSIKRPIPVSSPRSSFDPVFSSNTFRDVSPSDAPIARMRAPQPPPRQEQSVLSEQSSRFSENFVADKHRKWRRQIKLQRKRLERQDDDTSLLTTCGPMEGRRSKSKSKSKASSGKEPVDILAALIRAPCAHVDDIVTECHEGVASSDEEQDEENSVVSHDDDDSTHDTRSTHDDRQSPWEESEYTDDRQSPRAESEYTDERQSDFTGASDYDRKSDLTGQSEYTDDRQSDFTGASDYDRKSDFTGQSEYTDDRQSDLTGASEYTDASSTRLNGLALKTSSSGSRSSPRTQALSPSSSSIRSRTPTPPPRAFAEKKQAQSTDKNFIKAFIAELTNDGMLLIWHGPQGDSTAFRRPCGVVAHLNLGAPTDGVYEGPQLVWQKQDGSDGGVIDLFGIQSMDTASLDMLENYQFAIPDNTFFVVLNNGNHVVFEASSDTDAKRFIHGLRWVVARLSFNLVVGNPLVSCELLAVEGKTSASPQTPVEEALWSKAMNDVTNSLVDKSLTSAQTAVEEEEEGEEEEEEEEETVEEELADLCVD